jgi:hypothetical protein
MNLHVAGRPGCVWNVAGNSSSWRRKGNQPYAESETVGRAREARTARTGRASLEEIMDWKQMMRGKLACGFSCRRDESGRVEGHGVVKLPKRNPYELIGLRRPVRREVLRLRPAA